MASGSDLEHKACLQACSSSKAAAFMLMLRMARDRSCDLVVGQYCIQYCALSHLVEHVSSTIAYTSAEATQALASAMEKVKEKCAMLPMDAMA